MKKIINCIKGAFILLGVFCYCIFASFMLLFKNDE
jgi:hypothetical protein